MEDLLETEQMESLGTGVATHRGGREIDHIIVDAQTRARASEAEVMPGEKDDHKIVHADIILAEENADEGQHRRIGVKLDDWDEAEWATYVNEMSKWISSSLGLSRVISGNIESRVVDSRARAKTHTV